MLAPLYGGGALLVRETALRLGAGWPGIFLLGLAYGIVEEAYVDMSLFNPNFLGLRLLDYGYVAGARHGQLVDIVRPRAAHDLEHGRRDRAGRGAVAEPCRPAVAEQVDAPGHRPGLPARLSRDLFQFQGRLHAVTGADGGRRRRDRLAGRGDRSGRAAIRGAAERGPTAAPAGRGRPRLRRFVAVPAFLGGESAAFRRRPIPPSCWPCSRCRRS